MRDKLIGIGITIAIIAGAYLAFGGQGATQKWVDYRIAEQETNTQKVVDYKITVATNNYVDEIQRRIDSHLSTNGVTGAWVQDQIAWQEVRTQATVDQKIAASQTNSADMAQSTICIRTDSATATTYKCGKLTVVVQK